MAGNKLSYPTKALRANHAEKHTLKMQIHHTQEIHKCAEKSEIYTDCVMSIRNIKINEIKRNSQLVDMDTVSAIFKYQEGKTAVLNFASYRNPGGGFLNGSMAQEEALCHESFLYNVLGQFKHNYYDWNNYHLNYSLYENRALYSPDVLFVREGKEALCDVITCAAPNVSAALKHEQINSGMAYDALSRRISFIVDIVATKDIDTLILGAFGCGVFGNNPFNVIYMFEYFLEMKYCNIRNIIYAVPRDNSNNYEAFESYFQILK